MTIVVYLGPTMSWTDAGQILPAAIFLPPAAQSDIISVVDDLSPTGILLVDGLFTQQLSVWHKEILYALERGVAVYGSSSMGALRVAETAVFGARGFGEIFDAYLSGELTDDDEVTVMHASSDDGFRSLSDAMVNIRATLRLAREQAVINAGQHEMLIGLAKNRFYPERSYAALLYDAAGTDLPADTLAALGSFVRTRAVDQKRVDAIAMLGHVAEHGVEQPPPVTVTRSHPFQAMYERDRRVRRSGTSLPLADIGAYAALHLPNFDDMNERALHAGLVDVLGEMLKVEPGDDALALELQRFQTDRRLRTAEELTTWRRENDLNEDDFRRLIRQLATRRALRAWYVSRKYLERTTQEVLDEMRVLGTYPAVADAAGSQQSLLDAAHPDFTLRADDEDLLELIRAQARETGWRPTVGLDVWAFENGFKDVYDVRFELVRSKLARKAGADVLAALTAGSAEGPNLA
ncbi:TfuA-like protein [Nakamurella sp. PAMC28650]|uniref:TfuA-like protein n=1 Tax=Nakamurella sp. PAMC28650 TaxID=2762325 RepID=UPI00164EC3B7|nr:TfuA-like protein [Nakamurella sp. PAMC28650]QNK82121.1 hypothetical protein H7F38_05030 [Nakamurella sp. PAMC28650]